MVLCLLTLTDLQTRRAGLSASSELLVHLCRLCSVRRSAKIDVHGTVGLHSRTATNRLLERTIDFFGNQKVAVRKKILGGAVPTQNFFSHF